MWNGNAKLTYENSPENITENPFFYNGITADDYEKELEAMMKHYANGGSGRDYVPLWKQNKNN